MKILVTGATGLVGQSLVPLLTTGGHDVYRLTRSRKNLKEKDLCWDPANGELDAASLEGFDAVIHLAVENIAAGRWTKKQKERIKASRVTGTRLLSETIAKLKSPPKVFVCASAIGYYGDRGDEVLTEASPPGQGFLAEVCQQWELAADAARKAGIRVAHLRLGVILSPEGGALAKMLTPFKMGVGGILGSGQQYMSWVALDDVIGIVQHALLNEHISGAVNTVAPHPATNREFTKTLGKVLNRPTVFPVPAFGLRLLLGEMADELLLASTRVIPEKLQQSGYQFRFPDLEGALRHLLGR